MELDDLPEDWTPHQIEVFRRLYSEMMCNAGQYVHPKARTIPDEHWTTIAWNAAWTAAMVVSPRCELLRHVDERGYQLGVVIPMQRDMH